MIRLQSLAWSAGLLLLALNASTASACGGDLLVQRALSEKPEISAPAVSQLRQLGPNGLSRIILVRDEQCAVPTEPVSPEAAAQAAQRRARFDRLLDEVGGARYCSVSRLYWYTDLEAAKAQAAKEHKPILSLRMLGKLTDELSCANSRFFRTTLYSNEQISGFLRDNFILHWESVRPVPKITIDFGDGRRLERTITGNSAHYLLAEDGAPLDVLPGLYGPQAFREWLTNSVELFKQASLTRTPQARSELVRKAHERMAADIARRWQEDLTKVGAAPPVALPSVGPQATVNQAANPTAAVPPSAYNREALARAAAAAPAAPPAGKAAIRAVGKSAVEVPLLRAMAYDVSGLEAASDELVWRRIAALHAGQSRIDGASRAIIASENPDALAAGARAITKRRVEDPLARMVRNLEDSLALDGVRNEYLLHRQIHEWFARGQVEGVLLRDLNERVYAELFLTPSSDPWLGLAPADTYTALPRGGLTSNPPRP